jgi:hypothetical protein
MKKSKAVTKGVIYAATLYTAASNAKTHGLHGLDFLRFAFLSYSAQPNI